MGFDAREVSLDAVNQIRGIPTVDEREEGFVLVDSDDTPAAALGIMGLSGCFVLFPLLVFGFIFAVAGATGSAPPVWIAFFMVSIFVLVAGAMFVKGYQKLRVTQAWEPGALISPVWPIPLGQPVELHFRRIAKTADPSGLSLVGRLVLRESVTYRQGTDTRTVTEDVAAYPVDVSMLRSTGSSVDASMTLAIPPDAPPSFELKNNRLQWWLLLDPVGEGDDSHFKLWVRPETSS